MLLLLLLLLLSKKHLWLRAKDLKHSQFRISISLTPPSLCLHIYLYLPASIYLPASLYLPTSLFLPRSSYLSTYVYQPTSTYPYTPLYNRRCPSSRYPSCCPCYLLLPLLFPAVPAKNFLAADFRAPSGTHPSRGSSSSDCSHWLLT